MAEHLTNARQLLNWLAPKLNGREHLVQQLLELSSTEGEASDPDGKITWLHQGHPEYRQLFNTLIDTNPAVEWPELLHRNTAYEASIPQLRWVREALESVGLAEELTVEPSAPPLEQLSAMTNHSLLSQIQLYRFCKTQISTFTVEMLFIQGHSLMFVLLQSVPLTSVKALQ